MNRFVRQFCVRITPVLLIPLFCFGGWVLPASGQRFSTPEKLQNSILRVGVAKVDITPELPVALEGYEEPENRISTGVHDRLYVRVIAFEDGTRKLVLISCDLGGFIFAEYFLKLLEKEFRLRPEEILLCAIHTHSGPSLSLNKTYPHPNNYPYTSSVRARLINAVGQALATMHPTRIAFARGQSRVGVNRRKIMPGGTVEMGSNPDGPMDPEIPVLAIASPEGIPLAAIFAYSCHSRSLKGTNRLISGDVIGLAEQYVEKAVGGRYVCACFSGASGDIDPISVVSGFGELGSSPVPETVRLAGVLGEDVVRTFRVCLPVEAGKILTGSSSVGLPPKNPGKPKPIRVNAARIGEIGFVGLDCEAFVEVGLAIKTASPLKNIFIITNCNGWNGYLPVRHCYAEGGYEVRLSGFGPAAAEMLIEQAVSVLSSLRSP